MDTKVVEIERVVSLRGLEREIESSGIFAVCGEE